MTSANAAVKRLQSESLQQKALNELKQDAAELGLSKEDVRQFGNLTHKQTWLDAIGEALAREFDAVAEPEPNKANGEDEPNWDILKKNDVVLGETVETVEPEIKLDILHGLNSKNAAEAKALCNELGFWFVGTTDNWGEPEQSKIIETSGDWSFNYDYIGMFIEARCNGAVFNIDVEETNEEQDKELVNKAVATIKKAAEGWGLQFGQQLTIFCDGKKFVTEQACEEYQRWEEEGGAVEMNGWHRWDEKLQVWIKEDPEETLKDCYQPESESYRQQLLKRMKPYVGDCIQSEDFEQLKNEPLDESTAAIYLGLLEESERILTEAIAS